MREFTAAFSYLRDALVVGVDELGGMPPPSGTLSGPSLEGGRDTAAMASTASTAWRPSAASPPLVLEPYLKKLTMLLNMPKAYSEARVL